jgi:flavin reductase (DIM6/NTAB) family NADH-FMN oxidoreductase RutF
MSKHDPRSLRDAFGSFMTGVTVVTTIDEAGQPIGLTANSFTSVSLDPALLLVCIANTSSNYEALTKARGFAVNILAESQKDISNTFARPVDDRFADIFWKKGPFGSPVLANVSAWFDCSMNKIIEAGDHVILLGEVEAFESYSMPGLGYARGAYFTAANEADAVSRGYDVMVSALIAREGKIFLLDDGNGGLTLPMVKAGKEGAGAALNGLTRSQGIAAEAGFIYSVFEDNTSGLQHISFLCHADKDTTKDDNFLPLTAENLTRIANPAMQIMLKRFASETKLGNYGVYFGDHQSGNIHRFISGQ